MIISRMQLHCDESECDQHFPRDGAVDAALITMGELRKEARRNGWNRVKLPNAFAMTDRCPICVRRRLLELISKPTEVTAVS